MLQPLLLWKSQIAPIHFKALSSMSLTSSSMTTSPVTIFTACSTLLSLGSGMADLPGIAPRAFNPKIPPYYNYGRIGGVILKL